MTTFRQLLEEFDASAKTTAAKGRRFEEFCLDYFQTDPIWKERFDAVWPWMDWPGREGEADAGVCIHCNRCMPTIYTGTRCPLVDPRPGDRPIEVPPWAADRPVIAPAT